MLYYCNMVRWELSVHWHCCLSCKSLSSEWPTMAEAPPPFRPGDPAVCAVLQYFDTVGWVFWPVKTVSRITYTVLEGTLNTAHSSHNGLSSETLNLNQCHRQLEWLQYNLGFVRSPSPQLIQSALHGKEDAGSMSVCLIDVFVCLLNITTLEPLRHHREFLEHQDMVKSLDVFKNKITRSGWLCCVLVACVKLVLSVLVRDVCYVVVRSEWCRLPDHHTCTTTVCRPRCMWCQTPSTSIHPRRRHLSPVPTALLSHGQMLHWNYQPTLYRHHLQTSDWWVMFMSLWCVLVFCVVVGHMLLLLLVWQAPHSLQSGRFWATVIASSNERLLDLGSCWIVFIHVHCGP